MPSRGPSGRDGPHAFVVDLAHPVLDDADHHHLGRVARLRAGDPLTVSDGNGRWRACRFGDHLTPTGPVLEVRAPKPPITVAFALVKGDRPERIVRMLTEVGVDVVRPFAATRSVVRWDDAKAAAATERLRRVAREAAMQCRRCRVPEVHEPAAFATVADLPGAAMADRDGAPVGLAHPVVLIGPEGGWAPEESTSPLPRVHLAPHVLRADTAAIVAGALLVACREDAAS